VGFAWDTSGLISLREMDGALKLERGMVGRIAARGVKASIHQD